MTDGIHITETVFQANETGLNDRFSNLEQNSPQYNINRALHLFTFMTFVCIQITRSMHGTSWCVCPCACARQW